MSQPAHDVRYTLEEYVTLEAFSNVKHEFWDGQMFAMAGGTEAHSAIATTLASLLFPQLRGGRCRARNSDLRVHVPATGLSTYPDVSVLCGPPQHHAVDDLAVTNPTLLVEVLSKSTERYDRGEKFEHYKRLPSLRGYVLVSTRERSLEVWTRDDAGEWTSVIAREGDVAELSPIGARIDVTELYESALPGA
jgi:Uma2 family endonuclease